MKYNHTFGFLFLFFIGFYLHAQETLKNIDSTIMVLKKAPLDTSKTILYQKIGGHYNVTHLDSAKTFFEQGLALSKKLNYKKGSWLNLNGLGNYYERKTQYDSAMYYYNNALKLVKETQSTKGFAIVLNNIATIHIRKGAYDTALQFLFDALKAEEKLGNRNGIAQAYNNIGVVYYYTQNFDKTTDYLTRALEIQEELGNFEGLINGYNNVGAIYDYQKKYNEAIASYKKGLVISKKIKDKKMEAIQLSNMALAYTNKEDFINAEKFFMKSISIKESINDLSSLARSYASFGESLSKQKQYVKAKKYLSKGLEISKSNGLKQPKQEIYSTLSEIAQAQNDFKTANSYLYKFIAVKDSILNSDNAKIIAEVETKYETEKKEKEILKQRALLAEKELQVKQKNYMIFGSLSLAFILGLIGYLFFNQQKLKNRQLQKENELKTALAKIETQNRLQEQRLRISRDLHDNIGAQLTFIISSIDNLKYGFTDISDKLANKLTEISSFTTQTIYELRDTIWAMNKNNISFEDLQSRITNFIEKAKITSEKTKFSFLISPEVDQNTVFTSVQGMNMYRIIQEAVNNAIKYANASKVTVLFTYKEGLQFEIIDDGIGYHINEIDLGNGINNMKKRAKDLKGTLQINSEHNKGTAVKILIPKNKQLD